MNLQIVVQETAFTPVPVMGLEMGLGMDTAMDTVTGLVMVALENADVRHFQLETPTPLTLAIDHRRQLCTPILFHLTLS